MMPDVVYQMKINEILDQNSQWAILLDIKLSFDQEYMELVKIIETVIKVRHRSKYSAVLVAIDEFRKEATDLLTAKLPIPNDPDLMNIKESVKQMLTHLTQLEQNLK